MAENNQRDSVQRLHMCPGAAFKIAQQYVTKFINYTQNQRVKAIFYWGVMWWFCGWDLPGVLDGWKLVLACCVGVLTYFFLEIKKSEPGNLFPPASFSISLASVFLSATSYSSLGAKGPSQQDLQSIRTLAHWHKLECCLVCFQAVFLFK